MHSISHQKSLKVDATCKANGLDFTSTKIKEIPETTSASLNGFSESATNGERARGVAEAMAAAATLTSSSSDYMLAAGQAINSTNQVLYRFDFSATILIDLISGFFSRRTKKTMEQLEVGMGEFQAAPSAARDPRRPPR